MKRKIVNEVEILQQLVVSNIWKGNDAMVDYIFKQYVQLSEDDPETKFGSPEFWRAVLFGTAASTVTIAETGRQPQSMKKSSKR